MTYTVRPAVTSESKPLVGLYSESGRGKTKSALLLGKGFSLAMGGTMKDVVMIETESGRGEAYARDPEVGGFQVVSMRDNFSPKNYGAAIAAAEASKPKAVIIDSASHEWEGIGGVLAMAAKNQEDGKKGPLVWQRPKIDHQRDFMGRLLQTPIPLVIVCMRAKYPMYEVTQADLKKWEEAGRPGGKPPKPGEWARSWKLEPKQSDDILFEMFIHGWIDDEHKFRGTKYTLDELKPVIPDGERITVETGRRLAAWAAGRESARVVVGAEARSGDASGGSVSSSGVAHAALASSRGEGVSPSGESSAPTVGSGPTERELLLAAAREHAECGTDKYTEYWTTTLTKEQRAEIGPAKHAEFKAIAQNVSGSAT